jgi:hypothetical protein
VKLAQVDATYEYSLTASDACGSSPASVRLVRLNDTAPPSLPQVAQPAFDPPTHAIKLNWIPSTDNIQVDHYEVLRNGVPLTATDASAAIDPAPPQHTLLSYVVRAVDTNGNATDSMPVTYMTPDWTPPTEPVLTLDRPDGASVTLRWSAARDNVGVVRYDILRNEKVVGSVTGALRAYRDPNLKPALYTWRVRAVDDAGNATASAPQSMRVVKPHASAKVVSLKKVGAGRAIASRYSLKGSARLLLDLRVSGTIGHAHLRLYVPSGKGRITVWRGVPGSSAPRQRLHSAVVHHGWVTVKLGRAFHRGRIRLVLITSGRMVVIGTGKHKPSLRAG